jgi:hypothetical protein
MDLALARDVRDDSLAVGRRQSGTYRQWIVLNGDLPKKAVPLQMRDRVRCKANDPAVKFCSQAKSSGWYSNIDVLQEGRCVWWHV